MALPNPGFKSKLLITGTSTGTTAEPCSLVTGKTYQVTAQAKRVLDPVVARVWKDNGVTVAAANIILEDLLFGMVTFAAGYTVTGPVTLGSGSYLPRGLLAWVTGCKLAFKFENTDVTPIAQASGTGYRQRVPTTTDGSGGASLADPLNTPVSGLNSLQALALARTPVLFEYDLDGAGNGARMWSVLTDEGDDVKPTDVVRGDISFQLADQGTATALAGISFGTL